MRLWNESKLKRRGGAGRLLAPRGEKGRARCLLPPAPARLLQAEQLGGQRSSLVMDVPGNPTQPALRDRRVHRIRASVSTRTVAGLRLGGESGRAAGNRPVQWLRREAARGETTCLFLERLFGQPEELFGGCGRRAERFLCPFFFLVSRLDIEIICLV